MIKITASFSGVVSTGAYENEKPMFALEEEIAESMNKNQILKRQEELYAICREMFEKSERQSTAKRIQKEREDIRFYSFGNDQYPSVTSIINWDADFHVSPEELIQYASRGSIIHKQIEEYFKSNKWKEPKDIPECYPDLVILKKGSLGLTHDDVDFLGFMAKYPIDFMKGEFAVYNHGYKYAGRVDCKGIIEGKLSLIDFKTGSVDETKNFKQLTAYWHCEGNEDVEQVVIVHLNNDTKQGFSKPKICTDKNKYFSLFLKDRENFKKRFQI